MTWLAWRQQRTALLTLGGYALLLIALMTQQRFAMLDVLRTHGLTACISDLKHPDCMAAWSRLDPAVWRWRDPTDNVRFAILGYGLLAGVFLGAPLFAREFEQHTHLLALTQSTRPGRWYAAKVLVVAVPAAVGALALGLVYRWWTAALGRMLTPREGFHSALFEPQAPAALGYTVFAVGLGVVAGLVVRRVVPAMAVTLVGWSAAVYLVRRFVREHYMDPVVVERPYGRSEEAYWADPGRWRLDEGFTDAAGRFASIHDEVARAHSGTCQSAKGQNSTEYVDCMTALGYRSGADLVHPGDRFWWFQAIEATLFAGVGVLCLLGAMWWVRKRFRREIRVPAA